MPGITESVEVSALISREAYEDLEFELESDFMETDIWSVLYDALSGIPEGIRRSLWDQCRNVYNDFGNGQQQEDPEPTSPAEEIRRVAESIGLQPVQEGTSRYSVLSGE